MTNRFLFPLYLCFLSLPSFAADSGGVETWSPVIRPGAPSRSAKSDEQEKRKAESKLHQLSAEKSALAEENQRLKARLEKALDPKGSKENEKSSPASAAQSQEGGREYPSELEDLLRRHHALKNKDHAAYLTPPHPALFRRVLPCLWPVQGKADLPGLFFGGQERLSPATQG